MIKFRLVAVTIPTSIWLAALCPARGQIEEVPLGRSIQEYSDFKRISASIKIWENSNDANSHFRVYFLSSAETASFGAGFYQNIPVFDGQIQVELQEQESPDCSVKQTALYRITDGDFIIVTADRLEVATAEIPRQSDPRPQHLRKFVLQVRQSTQPGISSLWFTKVADIVTAAPICDVSGVREAMLQFASHP